jgi:hypothetical protein
MNDAISKKKRHRFGRAKRKKKKKKKKENLHDDSAALKGDQMPTIRKELKRNRKWFAIAN